MKKILALILALAMAFALAACGGNTEEETTAPAIEETQAPEIEETQAPEVDATEAEGGNEAADVEVSSALELLEKAWANHPEEEKAYFLGGNDFENPVNGAPGKFDMSDAEAAESLLGIPQAEIAKVDDVASIMHAMNGNNLTCGAYHLTDSANVQSFADALKEAIMNKQWMCGFPEKLIIVSVGDYVVCAYGSTQNIDNLKADFTAAYGDSVNVIYDEAITF
ncbi:MAG: hypothetical protein J6A60_06100 [Clostridia bacterium]|nr:hypothetical protein [Clostridia bacterium]